MPTRDLIVVGASAGGVEALRSFTAGLPADLDAAVAVALHLPAGGTSALSGILDRSGPLPAVTASHGMALRPGRVHVAPPDHHLIVIDGRIHLSHEPQRTATDPPWTRCSAPPPPRTARAPSASSCPAPWTTAPRA
ncbi:chemotaxis protein CheB [Saccharothrix yanglingensis]|uniref:protein-glutamate methylesterase n=1 Tax=Saccharothrix yanglingensis TaxID=659496 RepID=A0ABU0WWD6_9PSEU|nr:chemotaxis protein CheB [Saccharothrix yanglingensis]MDQ2584170.1 hypothetical protein [Saccharothrix yanglingensis]